MANVAVRGQPVEDPWLTWSTPEYGEGFWPVNDHEINAMALAQQSIPDMLGPKTVAYPDADPGYTSVIDDVDIDPGVLALIAAETRKPAIKPDRPAHDRPAHKSPTHYGAASSWGDAAPSFTSTLVGWGLLVRDPSTNKVAPTVRTGRLLFGTGVIAGLAWGLAGRSW